MGLKKTPNVERPRPNVSTVIGCSSWCRWLRMRVGLELLGANFRLRRRYDDSLLRGSVGGRFNCPLPAEMAILVVSPSCATAFPDLHSPIIAVGRNCEPKRDRSRDDHSAQYSNKKYPYRFIDSLHFPYSLIEARRHADCFIWPLLI